MKYVVAALLAVFMFDAGGAEATVLPIDPEPTFEAWAAKQGTPVESAACDVPDVAPVVCYGISGTTVVVAWAFQNNDGTLSPFAPFPHLAPTGAAPTTTVSPVLHRDAELAVRACVDQLLPESHAVSNLVFNDDGELVETQAACDAASDQLEVEPGDVANPLSVCVAEINLALSTANLDWNLFGTVSPETVEAWNQISMTNGTVMTQLVDNTNPAATCNDDVEPIPRGG